MPRWLRTAEGWLLIADCPPAEPGEEPVFEELDMVLARSNDYWVRALLPGGGYQWTRSTTGGTFGEWCNSVAPIPTYE